VLHIWQESIDAEITFVLTYHGFEQFGFVQPAEDILLFMADEVTSDK
jgi:hypothetical protein